MNDAISSDLRVLIVDDEAKISAVIADYLQREAIQSHCLNEGTGVVEWIRDNKPDLVLLNLMLPGKNGNTICREVRAFSNVPIIMVTAKVEEVDRLLGLELGADDYICKPFSNREVVARVKAVLRRTHGSASHEDGYRGLTIDSVKFSAQLDGKTLGLTPVEFRMLALLLAQPGRVYSRSQLMDAAYTDNRIVSDRTIDTHVKNLRRKIEQDGDEPLLHSVYGVGYKIE